MGRPLIYETDGESEFLWGALDSETSDRHESVR